MKATLLLLAGAAGAAAGARIVDPTNRLFGHSIKNGPLPANTELTTFEHNCTTAPCTITQIHIPSIYPGSGCPWDWENGRLRFYIDGEATPSIDISILELAHVGKSGAVGNNPPADGSPFGHDLFGKTAHTGGVYSTMRIPFGASFKSTITAPPSCASQSIFWFVIRGIEGLPVTLGQGELQLPDQARLHLYRNVNVTLQPQQFITIAQADPSTAGALVSLLFDAASSDFNFLEACVRFERPDDSAPIALSSGTEDFFLSASYFDEGMFKTSQSGVTYDNGGSAVAMYKVHASRDLILWGAGMNLTWRNNEDGSCPTGWAGSSNAASTATTTTTTSAMRATAALQPPALSPMRTKARESQRDHKSTISATRAGSGLGHGLGTAPDTVNTLVFYYSWPASAEGQTFGGVPAAQAKAQEQEQEQRQGAAASTNSLSTRLATIRALASSSTPLLSSAQEERAVRLVLQADQRLAALLDAYTLPANCATTTTAAGTASCATAAQTLASHVAWLVGAEAQQ